LLLLGGDVTVKDLDDAIEVGNQYSGLHLCVPKTLSGLMR
jgi:hypothetical protein